MRMALYVEAGVTQFVLTPESDWEKKTLADLTERLSPNEYPSTSRKSVPARIFGGSFYHCQGGWVRQGPMADPQSLIVRFDAVTTDD